MPEKEHCFWYVFLLKSYIMRSVLSALSGVYLLRYWGTSAGKYCIQYFAGAKSECGGHIPLDTLGSLRRFSKPELFGFHLHFL